MFEDTFIPFLFPDSLLAERVQRKHTQGVECVATGCPCLASRQTVPSNDPPTSATNHCRGTHCCDEQLLCLAANRCPDIPDKARAWENDVQQQTQTHAHKLPQGQTTEWTSNLTYYPMHTKNLPKVQNEMTFLNCPNHTILQDFSPSSTFAVFFLFAIVPGSVALFRALQMGDNQMNTHNTILNKCKCMHYCILIY